MRASPARSRCSGTCSGTRRRPRRAAVASGPTQEFAPRNVRPPGAGKGGPSSDATAGYPVRRERPRVPREAQARRPLVHEVPREGQAGRETARSSVVRARPPSRRVLTRRTATQALHAPLTDARKGAFAVEEVAGATFAAAAEEWLRHGATERGLKPSTLRDYRSAISAHLLPAVGSRSIHAITSAEIEEWRSEGLATGWFGRRTATRRAPLPMFGRLRLLLTGGSLCTCSGCGVRS